MLWKIERFDTSCARGYVCLPDRSASAKLLVYSGKGQPLAVECNFMRADLKKSGLHQTGLCGFFIGPEAMAKLHPAPIVAIFEESSRLLLYRHSSEANFIQSRLFFLTAPSVDNGQVMAALGARHRLYYRNAETLDDETLGCLLKPSHSGSILLCAALTHRLKAARRALATNAFRGITLLTRPAAAFMRQVATLAAAAPADGERRFVSDPDLADLADSLKDIDPRETDQLGAWLRRASEPGLAKLSNPMVRFYAGVNLDETVAPSHLSAALRTLGLLSAVGLTERLGEFGRTVGELIGAPDLSVEDEAPDPELLAMAEAAERLPEIEALTVFDRMLYDLVAYALSAEEPSLEEAGNILRG